MSLFLQTLILLRPRGSGVSDVIGFVVGGLMIAVFGLSYGFTIRALPLTGDGMAFAMAALGRTHAFIAGWALTLGYSCVVALNAPAVTLVFCVTFPELVMGARFLASFSSLPL